MLDAASNDAPITGDDDIVSRAVQNVADLPGEDNQYDLAATIDDEPASEVTGVPLKDLHLKSDLLVSCIYRDGRVRIPNGFDQIQVGDTIMVVTTHTGFSDLQDILA